jgi:lipoprotein-anchoring transpeptidase ErfK/SrfK
MSARHYLCASLFGLCATAAHADGLLPPGFGAAPPLVHQGYREAQFPPLRHNAFGQPLPPRPRRYRPSYTQTIEDFPPAPERLGGGFLEYVVTGGRSAEPQPAYQAVPQSYGAPQVLLAPQQAEAPAYGAINPAAATLPRGGLPEYRPQPEAFFGSAPAGAYNTPAAEPVAPEAAQVGRQIDPSFQRQDVAYSGPERPGTIIIDTPEKFLFLVEPGGRALRYGIGVGRPGFTWAGVKTISRKAEWPDWTPPSEMLLRRPDLPRHMAGGVDNPLGARALYLGSSMYRIHGTNQPWTIGTNVSSGCIRMMNEDVEDIYGRVRVGTRVVVL